MEIRKILVPVYGSMRAADIARNAFWVARTQNAELYLVQLIPPLGFVSWLLSPFVKKRDDAGLGQVLRGAIWQEHIRCRRAELRVANLLVGIVEATRQFKPDIITLAPEIQDYLGRIGVEELKKRLGEVKYCMLILPARCLAFKIVWCGNNKDKGSNCERGTVIFPQRWRKSAGEMAKIPIGGRHELT